MKTLVFATNNKNKLTEIQKLFPSSFKILGLKDIGCHEDIPETQPTIEGNAMQKAQYVYEKYGYPCFADDTGLEVDALDGEPGVLSARYAGPSRDAEENMAKVLDQLRNKSNRKAQFKTVVALCSDDSFHSFSGICRGSITTEKRGKEGFGYDPIFLPEGYGQTFAEMDMDLKNSISHRGRAISKLLDFITSDQP